MVNWCIENRVVNLARVHRNLYHRLREVYRLPARLALDAIRQGIWIAKGWLRNPKRGRRPVIRRLSMVLTPNQSFTLKMKGASAHPDYSRPDATPSRDEGENGGGPKSQF